MKMSIPVKLFMAVFLACSTVLVIQGVTMRLSFQHDVIDYINNQGYESMNPIVPRLAMAYRQHGSWDFMHNNPFAWIDLIRPYRSTDDFTRDLSIEDQTGTIVRMGLLDDKLQRITGNYQANAQSIRWPIIIDGKIVGWLALVSFEKMMTINDAHFLAKQRKSLWIIATGSIFIVALLTFVLTRTLLSRLGSMARATHALSSGDYGSRIEVNSNDELGRLAQDFNRMAQALENNESSRRTFMADISHELRTPLAVIRAELEAMQDGIRPSSTQTLEGMHQQVQQLGKLVDDLHDLAITDSGPFAYQCISIDLLIVLRTVLNGMHARFESAGLHLAIDIGTGPLIISGDERRLQQLFSNLFENTLRYTNHGGSVLVRCRHQNDVITIMIEDSAPRVPEDKIHHLFDRFYRVDSSRNRAKGGSGLGLAICRNIVEAHDGHIGASTSALGGLCISIDLTKTKLS